MVFFVIRSSQTEGEEEDVFEWARIKKAWQAEKHRPDLGKGEWA